MEPLDGLKNSKTLLIFSILGGEKNKVLAWAFLKPVAANGATNIGRLLRLQLFNPRKSSRDDLESQVNFIRGKTIFLLL